MSLVTIRIIKRVELDPSKPLALQLIRIFERENQEIAYLFVKELLLAGYNSPLLGE